MTLHLSQTPTATEAALRALDSLQRIHHLDDVRSNVLAAMTIAVANAASYKRIPIDPGMHESVAAYAVDNMTIANMTTLAVLEPSAVGIAQAALSRALDIFAAIQVRTVVASMLGQPPHDPAVLVPFCAAWIDSWFDPTQPAIWPDIREIARSFVEALTTQAISNESADA